METIQKYIELARLICKRRLWGLNGREAEQLEAWLKENPRDKSAFKNLQHIDPEGLADRYEKIDIDRQWKNFQKRTAWRTYIWWRVGVVAAGICLLLGTGWLFYRKPVFFLSRKLQQRIRKLYGWCSLQGESWTFRTVKM